MHRENKFFYEAVESVLNSVDVRPRLIIIDDRLDKSQKLKGNFALIETDSVGYGAAINASKDLIDTEYVGLMNSDDLSCETRFIKQIFELKFGDISLSTCKLQKFSGEKMKKIYSLGGSAVGNRHNDYMLLFSSFCANASWVTTSQYWHEKIYFDTHQNGSDWKLAADLHEEISRWGYLSEPLYYYRQHSTQTTKLKTEYDWVLVKAWEKLNCEKGLPKIPGEIGLNLTFPGIYPPLDLQKVEIENLELWLLEITKMLTKQESEILQRRLTGYIASNFTKPGNLGKKLKLCSTTASLSMTREFLANRISW